MQITTQIFLAFIIGSFSIMAHAASCDQLRADIKTASDLLNKAQQASRFDDAKRGIKKAGTAINTLAEDSRSCPCIDAANLFDDAAAKIRRASDTDAIGRSTGYSEPGGEIDGAAIGALNACPESLQEKPPGDESLQEGNRAQNGEDAQSQ